MTRAVRGSALLAAGALLVSGCATDVEPLEPRPRVDEGTSETRSLEEISSERAMGTVAGYFTSANGIYADPEKDLRAATVENLAEGSAKARVVSRATRLFAAKQHQTGVIEARDLKVTSVDLELDKNGKTPKWPTVLVSGCIDRSEAQTVNASGKPVKDPELRSVKAEFSVRNTSWPDLNGWRLSWFRESKTSC